MTEQLSLFTEAVTAARNEESMAVIKLREARRATAEYLVAARKAATLPWPRDRLWLVVRVFRNASECLPQAECDALRAEFRREIARFGLDFDVMAAEVG